MPSFSGGRVAEAGGGNGSGSGYVSVDIESTATFNSGLSAATAAGEASDATAWYVRPPSGGQYGPVDTAGFRQWIGEGRVAADSWVWRTGWSDWKPGVEALRSLSVEHRRTPPPLPTTPGGRRAPSAPRKTAAVNGSAKPQPALAAAANGDRFAGAAAVEEPEPVVTSSTTPALGFDLNSEFDELFAPHENGNAGAELLKPVIRVAARDQRMRRRKTNQILTLVLAALALVLLVVLVAVMKRQNHEPTPGDLAETTALTLTE